MVTKGKRRARYNLFKSEMELFVYDFQKKDWTEEKIIYRNNLLSLLHKGTSYFAVGQIPSKKSPTQTDYNIWEGWMREGITHYDEEQGLVKLYLDIAGSSRTHGRFIFSYPRIGEIYYGNNPMGRINYGSILLTSCRRAILRKSVKWFCVDETDEDQKSRVIGYPSSMPGDAHGVGNTLLLMKLSSGLQGIGQSTNLSLQVRIALIGDDGKNFVWKGTVSAASPVPEVDGDSDYELLLPTSGFKGLKPPEMQVQQTKMIIGVVDVAVPRVAKGSQMLWMWYPWLDSVVAGATIPGLYKALHDITDYEASTLALALDFPQKLAKILGDVEKVRADIDFSGEVGETEDFEESDEAQEGDEVFDPNEEIEYIDPVVLFLANDRSGQLLKHPWIVKRVRERLGKRWRRLAINGAIIFDSRMGQPLDMLPVRTFTTSDLPSGNYIAFRNPIRHWGDIKVWLTNQTMSVTDHTIWMSHDTAAEVGGDFDGDWYQLLEPVTKGFHTLISSTEKLDTLYGTPPEVVKYPKQKIEGGIEYIAVRSMDNKTGIISNLIQKAQANNTITRIISVPDIDVRTGTVSGNFKDVTVIAFLSQEMQVAVDRLKNNLYHNEVGINEARNAIESVEVPEWLASRLYKDNRAYIDFAIPGTGNDTVSEIIKIVNRYWKPYPVLEHHVSEFRGLFPNKSEENPAYQTYNQGMLDWARSLNKWYGEAMNKALSIGKAEDGSDPNFSEWLFERKKAVKLVREQALKNRAFIDFRLESVELFAKEFLVEYPSEKNWRNISFEYQRRINRYVSGQPHVLIPSVIGIIPTADLLVSRLMTSLDWCACFWDACHGQAAGDETTGSLVFLLFPDEIMERVKTPHLQVLKVIGAQYGERAATIWGDYDSVIDEYSTEYPPRTIYSAEFPLNSYRPSDDLLLYKGNANRMLGKIQPGTSRAEIYVKRNPENSEEEWKLLGQLGDGGSVPDADKFFAVRLFTQSIRFVGSNIQSKTVWGYWMHIQLEDWPPDF